MNSTHAQQVCGFPISLSPTVLMLYVFILGSKLNLNDLLAPLASQSSTLLSLKKSTKILASASSSKAKTLSAPLPHRIQERLDREAAYEQTKEEVDKWSGTMKRIREVGQLIRICLKTLLSSFFCRLSISVSLYKPNRRDASPTLNWLPNSKCVT